MKGIDVSKVLVGAPDQLTTGAILDAPLGTTLPTDAKAALDEAFTASGYCSDDGLKLTMDRSTNDIADWSGTTVRKILESFDGTLAWSEMQMSYEALCHAFGDDHVERVPATKEHGEQVTITVNKDLPPRRSWTFNMKDGAARVRIVVPDGQVTNVDEIDFVANDAVKLPLTLTTYPDKSGNNIYIYVDDGLVAAA